MFGTYIHTYKLRARRINIAQLMRGTSSRNPQACIHEIRVYECFKFVGVYAWISISKKVLIWKRSYGVKPRRLDFWKYFDYVVKLQTKACPLRDFDNIQQKSCLSVYVWACMFHCPWHAEGFQTYIHPYSFDVCAFKDVSAGMFEPVCLFFPHRQRKFKHTYMLNTFLVRRSWRLWACMFERVCFIFADRQRVFQQIHACSFDFW